MTDDFVITAHTHVPLSNELISSLIRTELDEFIADYSGDTLTTTQQLRASLIQWLTVFLREYISPGDVGSIEKVIEFAERRSDYNYLGSYCVLPLNNALFAMTYNPVFLYEAFKHVRTESSGLRGFTLNTLALVADMIELKDAQELWSACEYNLENHKLYRECGPLLLAVAEGPLNERTMLIRSWAERFPDGIGNKVIQGLGKGEVVENEFARHLHWTSQYAFFRINQTYASGTQLNLFALDDADKDEFWGIVRESSQYLDDVVNRVLIHPFSKSSFQMESN
jgi:hypothetical protein